MNLTRALNAALPDIPARTVAERPPRLDPELSFREHIEDGKPIVRIYVPSAAGMFAFPVEYWKLAQLFDGVRSYDEIAELYSRENGVEYDGKAVREFAGDLEVNGFWYRTKQEKNIMLLQQSADERRKTLRVKSKWADLSDVTFPAFNPDRFLTWLYEYTKFFYTPWFTMLSLIAFACCAALTISHWEQIGRDSVEFYNFTNKSWGDVLALYTLGMSVVAIHEFAHAHACKHYGGHVRAMGFALVYLTPAFYTDTTEGATLATRYQRLIIVMAGIWAELILCSIATPIWWGTPPQTLIHDSAYFIMMMTGLMSVVLNWNPLMRLDGYFMLCEIVGVADIKERSTAFVSAWVKRNIWRLEIEVPYVPKRRRFGFAIYALLSGAYSYTVLYIVARFAGNFVRNFSPEWGFLPEIGVAILIFRSRIRLLVNFMKLVYLDKKDRILAWFTVRNASAVTVCTMILLTLPVWHESVTGRFFLEPVSSVELRAHVPGTLVQLKAVEGQRVITGEKLVMLNNVPLQSKYDELRAQLVLASDRAIATSDNRSVYGANLKMRDQLTAQVEEYSAMHAALELSSPISGVVVTPSAQNLLGTYVSSGSKILEVADETTLRARIYISEYDFSHVKRGANARIQVRGLLRTLEARIIDEAARPVEMDPGLKAENESNGLHPLHYYLVELHVDNPDMKLRPGMMGIARVYGERRSIAGMLRDSIADFCGRKVW